jgi:hypothetical protein
MAWRRVPPEPTSGRSSPRSATARQQPSTRGPGHRPRSQGWVAEAKMLHANIMVHGAGRRSDRTLARRDDDVARLPGALPRHDPVGSRLAVPESRDVCTQSCVDDVLDSLSVLAGVRRLDALFKSARYRDVRSRGAASSRENRAMSRCSTASRWALRPRL